MARELKIRIAIENTPEARAALANVEQGLQQVETAGGKVKKEIGDEKSGLAGGLMGLSRAFAAVGVTALVADVVEWGGKLSDLSLKTGITTEALQRLAYVGDLSGVSIDSLANGVLMLQRRLAGGDESALKALDKLGLSLSAMLALSPDKMLGAIARELAKIPDPAQRSLVAFQLLGRNGQTILPVLLQNVEELGNAIPTMSDKSTAGLDKMGDGWTRIKHTVKNSVGEGIGSLANWDTASERFLENITFMEITVPDQMKRIFDVGPIAAAREELDSMTDALGRSAAGIALADSKYKELPLTLGSATDALKKFNRETSEDEKRTKERIAAWEAQTKAIRQLADQLTGRKMAEELRNLSAAFDQAQKSGGLLASEADKLYTKLDQLQQAGGKLDERQRKWFDERTQQNLADARKLMDALVSSTNGLDAALQKSAMSADLLTAKMAAQLTPISKSADDIIAEINRTAISFDQLGQPPDFSRWRMWAQNFGQMLNDIQGQFNQWGTDLGDWVGKKIPGILGGGLGSITKGLMSSFGNLLTGGINSLVQMGAQLAWEGLKKLGGAIASAFGHNSTKGGREDFAKSQGFSSLDELYAKLRSMGPAGEALWHQGINVIGKNDTAANQKWMGDVYNLLNRNQSQGFDFGGASADFGMGGGTGAGSLDVMPRTAFDSSPIVAAIHDLRDAILNRSMKPLEVVNVMDSREISRALVPVFTDEVDFMGLARA